MNKSYDEWLDLALEYRERLDLATDEENQKDVIYYRGKYIYALKQAYKLNNEGILPSDISGLTDDVLIIQEIKRQLRGHQRQIDLAIKENKEASNIDTPSISKEIGLKFRRLATRVSQVNFATGVASKGDIFKDSLSLSSSTFLKSPTLITCKVLSKVGPLAVSLIALPINLISSIFFVTIDVGLGQVNKDNKQKDYNNTIIHKMSRGLSVAVNKIFESSYNAISKM